MDALADGHCIIILGKKHLPETECTIYTDESRVRCQTIRLPGSQRVKDLGSTEVVRLIRDIAAGQRLTYVKTRKRGCVLRGAAMCTGIGTISLLGAILT